MPVLLLTILVASLVISGVILYKNKDPKTSKEHRGSTSKTPTTHIFEFEESAVINLPKYKICPKCGYILAPFESRYSDEICRYCGTLVEFIPEEYRSLPWEAAMDKYCKDHIIINPEKRVAYKDRKEIMKIESEMYDRELERRYPVQENVPKCPTCGSTDVEKLTSLDRGVSVSVLGPFSNKINKSFKCRDCKYTW